MSMTAKKVLDRAEELGILEPKVIQELRRQVAESKFVVSAEVIVKLLVDKKHLTAFQARKLVAEATTEPEVPAVHSAPSSAKPGSPSSNDDDELTFLDSPVAALTPEVIEDDEEIVDLEEALPPSQPLRAKVKPLPTKTESKKSDPKKPKAARPARPEEEIIDLGSQSSLPPKASPQLTPLKPIGSLPGLSPLPPTPANPPPPGLTPLHPVANTPGLQPLGGSGLAPLGGVGLSPLGAGDPFDTSLGGTSLGGGLAPPPPEEPASTLKKKKARTWDSPILLIGGGALGIIAIAFVVLYFALTRGTAQQLLDEANTKYRDAQYATAIELYDQFLKKYPEDPNVSLAAVKRGMARIRTVYDGASDMRQALETSATVLPEIEAEDKFDEARPELESMLPSIADSFATNARSSTEMKRIQAQVESAHAAMKLVNNAAYLPTSRRNSQQARIDNIQEKIRAAERIINQGQALNDAMTGLEEKLQAGDIAGAYQVRARLLQDYPTLESNANVVKNTLAISARERDLVVTTPEDIAAGNDDPHVAPHRQLALANRSGEVIQAPANSTALLLIRGNVYAIDVASGEIRWRRFVGSEVRMQPLVVGDGAILADQIDPQSFDLLRVDLATGKFAWRQTFSESFLPPQALGEHLFVTLQSGRVVRLNAATGTLDRAAQLPQAATAGMGIDGRGKLLVQPSEHSTLFVLAAEESAGEPLACQSAFYLGHKPESIAVPPAVVVGHVFVFENNGIDSCLVHSFKITKERTLERVRDPIRLRGRTITSPSIARNRLVAVTELGDMLVLDVDSSNEASPVNITAQLVGGLKQAVVPYHALLGSRLVVADTHLADYEIVATRQTLDRGPSTFDGDAFVVGLQVYGGSLVHARQRAGARSITVTGVNLSDKKSWQLVLSSPLVGVQAYPAQRQFGAVSADGSLFEIPAESFKDAAIDRANSGIGGSFAQNYRAPLALPENKAVLLEQAGAKWALLESKPGGGIRKVDPVLPAGNTISAPLASFKGGVLAALSGGSIWLFDPTSGGSIAAPFQPELAANAKVNWLPPVVVDDRQFIALDAARGIGFLVRHEPQPEPFLAETKSFELSYDAFAAALLGKMLLVLARGDSVDEVVAYSLPSLQETKRVPLEGRVRIGGFNSNETNLFCEMNNGELLRISITLEIVARRKLADPLAAPPVPQGNDLLLVGVGGSVLRMNEAGETTPVAMAGQPLTGAVKLLGANLIAGGADGTLHVLSVEAK